MNQIVPPRFLFRWSFVAQRIEGIPHAKGRLLDLPEECALPSLSEIDSRRDFACLKLGWNDAGLGVSVDVRGRTRPPDCHENEIERSDGIRLWIDTRNTQTVHRATRFCHQFVLLPKTRAHQSEPVVRSLPIARAREEVSLPDASLVTVRSHVSQTAYSIDAWFPAKVLVGFDPGTNPKIGFHYMVHDSELGDQTLAVGREFPCESDPSLWQTVELVS